MLKKFSLLFFTIIYLNNYIISQSLTVNETIKYISDQYIKNSQPEINRMNLHYGYKLINFRIDISEDGYIKIVTSKTHPSNPRINDEIKFHYNDVEIRIDDHNEIEIICNYSRKCISFSSSSPYMLGHIHACITEPKYVERISNAFKYLISILPNYPEYNINDGDPFSNLNFKKDISSTVSESILKIKLFESEGVFSLDALLGGIKRRVIFDSGASEVSISKEAEISLINASVISNDNYIQSGLFRTAGGNIISSRRFIIPYIKVGEFKVSNVICSVNPTDDLILLGRSFLNKI